MGSWLLEQAAEKYAGIIGCMQPRMGVTREKLYAAEAFWRGRGFPYEACVVSDEKTTILLSNIKICSNFGAMPLAILNRVKGILTIFNYSFLAYEAALLQAFENRALTAISRILVGEMPRECRFFAENVISCIDFNTRSSLAALKEADCEARMLLNLVLAPLELKIIRRGAWMIKSREGLFKPTGSFLRINALNGKIIGGAKPCGAGGRRGWRWRWEEEVKRIGLGEAAFTLEIEGGKIYLLVKGRRERGSLKADILAFEVHEEMIEVGCGTIPLKRLAEILRKPEKIHVYTVKIHCRSAGEVLRVIRGNGFSVDSLPNEVKNKLSIQALIEGVVENGV